MGRPITVFCDIRPEVVMVLRDTGPIEYRARVLCGGSVMAEETCSIIEAAILWVETICNMCSGAVGAERADVASLAVMVDDRRNIKR